MKVVGEKSFCSHAAKAIGINFDNEPSSKG